MGNKLHREIHPPSTAVKKYSSLETIRRKLKNPLQLYTLSASSSYITRF